MYIGCIIDQSNWSGPFSIVVMTPDMESGDLGSHPGWGSLYFLLLYQLHPSLYAIFKALLTVPLTLKTYLRNTISQERLTGLHQNINVDTRINIVINEFDAT